MRATGDDTGSVLDRWRAGVLLAGLAAVPVASYVLTVAATRDPGRASMVSGQVAGVVLLVAAALFYLDWRGRPMPEQRWTVAVPVLVGIQVLACSSSSLAWAGGWQEESRCAAVDAAFAAVALGLVIAIRRTDKAVDPLLLGLGPGIALAGLSGLGPRVPRLADLPVVLSDVAAGVVLVTFLALARAILADRLLPRRAAVQLTAAACLVGLGEAARSVRWSEDVAGSAGSLAIVTGAVLWAGSGFTLVHGALQAQGLRLAALEESLHDLSSDARMVREKLHEVESTVAGIASATRLLDRPVRTETRQRLERTIHAELGRMERLLAGDGAGDPGPVDLDEALGILLESHRARGRTIEWQPCGAQVHGRRDDVTAVLNILLDNAAKHGGGTPSRVDVSDQSDEIHIAVCDEGPGVPHGMREHIFDWGGRADATPGQGIGLHLARRLVTQHGGSLSVTDADASGSAFVVRLPAARSQEETHVRYPDHLA